MICETTEGYEESTKSAVAKDDLTTAHTILNAALKNAESKGSLSSHLVYSAHDLAALFCIKREYDSAEALYRKVLKVKERVHGVDHPELCDTLEKLSVVLREGNHKADAAAIAFRAHTLAQTVPRH